MSLQPGQALGGYTIVAKLGEGGMGEVYRATDPRLGRDVAIKVLPASVANDPDRRARFEREAKALASLNHFNIAQVYGFEGAAMVMELLEGETLRDRLANGGLPIRKALDFGAQIARGLAAAHERGIIHRDLKPENVFIVNDGQIKILDFGLARQSSEMLEATATGGGTGPGVVLGTAGYMSPEQVRAQVVDTRSDVFALGAVLYEMLTGKRAFRRDSAAETMSAILNEHPPDLTAVRADISPSIDRIVQHCLEKQPSERFQSARDVAFALEALSGSASSAHAAAAPLPSRNRERFAWAAATAVLAAALLWTASRPASPPATNAVVTRTRLLLPADVTVNEGLFPGTRLALSPDSSQVAFAGRNRSTGQSHLYVMSLDGGTAQPLPNTKDGGAPVWSPDGRQLLFADFQKLYRVSLDGGPPVAIADFSGFAVRGTWNRDGVVLVGGPQLRRGNAQGGAFVSIRGIESERYGYPQFLSDHRHYLFGVFEPASGQIAALIGELDTDATKELIKASDLTNLGYAAGAVVFSRDSTIYAQWLDETRLELLGEPVILATDVQAGTLRGSAFSVSNAGLMVYQTSDRFDTTQLAWLDRGGRVVATIGEPADFTNVELSADGRRVLVSATDSQALTRDIHIIDVDRGVRQRFTLDPSEERSAIWSPDQREIIYTSKGLDLYRRAADLSGTETGVVVDRVSKDPYDWSRDGRWLIYRRSGAATGNDLYLRDIATGEERPVAASRYSEVGGNFSPDGKWIVYVSDESGQFEVYATRVEGGGKIQISSSGGTVPRWRGDGREITYVSADRMLMSAMVERTAPTLEVSAPRALFPLDIEASPGPIYDIVADGSRFIVARRVVSKVPPSLNVLHNWPALLPARRP
ncbi:MAG TPA: protein kinase [Vicinamibacterales bacterium]